LLLAGCGTAASSGAQNTQATTATQEASGGQQPTEQQPEQKPAKLLIAAAASLQYSFSEQLIPLFVSKYPHITVEGAYDSSGKLLTQIEEGLEADVFMSASMKEMNTLKDEAKVETDTIAELLENRIVLIAPADSVTDIASFQDIGKAETIALGDPESVPAGRYAKEALTSLGIYEEIQPKVSQGTNVTEVLNWVAEGSADVGIVYATDAATTDKVKILAEAPEGSLASKVIYPVGVLSRSEEPEAARLFVDFLQSAEALAVFSSYGFTPNL
jgi:molybdate transport system substrate-binding protein